VYGHSGAKLRGGEGVRVWGGGALYISSGISIQFRRANFELIFECLGLKFFDKFTKIFLKNFTNYGKLFRKLVKNAMSGIHLPQKNNFGKRNVN
jgi:hypothetical protein